jgi:N utilization substance protein B
VTARGKARRRALDILFEADIKHVPAASVLEARIADDTRPVSDYAVELVNGVQEHQAEIDELLAGNSHGWTVDRMPVVDRNILRIGAYELLWGGAPVPEAVAISEAVLLAGDLSTEASSGFVNGLLARIAEIKRDRDCR